MWRCDPGVFAVDVPWRGITLSRLGNKMKADTIARFSVSLPRRLLRQLDEMARQKGYDNRSHAVADMVRDQLVEHQQHLGHREIAGTITLVYDHHKPHLQEVLTGLQHAQRENIISSLHVHLDHDHCLEVLVVRGQASLIKSMSDRLIGAKGVKHGKLTVTTTGKDLG